MAAILDAIFNFTHSVRKLVSLLFTAVCVMIRVAVLTRTPACDGQTDGHTHGHSIYRASIARAVKILNKY